MNEENNSEQIRKIEARLGQLSSVTLKQNFLSWDELSRLPIKNNDLISLKAKTNLIPFSSRRNLWLGTGLLAAASLGFVFLLSELTLFKSESQHTLASKASESKIIFQSLAGQISNQKGDNLIQLAGSTEKKTLAKETKIDPGSHLFVGQNGYLDLEYANKSWIRLASLTEVEISESKTSETGSVQIIKILKGKILIKTGKLKKDSVFLVQSGDVETRVRGTTFSVSYDGLNKQVVAVREGAVEVKSSNSPDPIILETKKQLSITDKKISQVVDLAPLEEKEMKALQTQVTLTRENELYSEFSRLELVRLEDGTELRGVILGQTESALQLESIDGKIDIPIAKIYETEKIR